MIDHQLSQECKHSHSDTPAEHLGVPGLLPPVGSDDEVAVVAESADGKVPDVPLPEPKGVECVEAAD